MRCRCRCQLTTQLSHCRISLQEFSYSIKDLARAGEQLSIACTRTYRVGETARTALAASRGKGMCSEYTIARDAACLRCLRRKSTTAAKSLECACPIKITWVKLKCKAREGLFVFPLFIPQFLFNCNCNRRRIGPPQGLGFLIEEALAPCRG